MPLIVSVFIPHVAIALARHDDPSLIDQPLALYTQERRGALVAVASPDTGLAPGSPLRQAIVRAPGAVYRPLAPERDSRAIADLLAMLETYSPRVDTTTTTPHAQFDLDAGHISIAQAIALAQRLARQIATTLCLVPALGIATTRFVAQRAAQHAGCGVTVLVPPGDEATFLALHPVSILPIDTPTIERLQRFGLHTIGALARIPLDALQVQFGALGWRMYQLARGQDETRIAPSIVPSTLMRRALLAGPVTDRTLLERAIDRLATRLADDLAAAGGAARTIQLTFTLDTGAPWTEERVLSTPTTDAARLCEAFRALGRTASLETGVEVLTLQVIEVAPTIAAQLDLFAPAHGQTSHLAHVLERLNARYAGSFVRAQLARPNALLPEQRVRFQPLDLA